MDTNLDDIEEQVISITGAEVCFFFFFLLNVHQKQIISQFSLLFSVNSVKSFIVMQAINLLKASLVTSTPLTTALGNLFLKKPKEERV